jgi:hypothetical protein
VEITDTFTFGAELRTFYVGLKVGEGLPYSGDKDQDHLFMAGLRLALNWYPLEELSVHVQGEGRYKYPGWDSEPIPGFRVRPWVGYVSWTPEPVDLRAGLMVKDFGTGALLDQRVLGLDTAWHVGPVDIGVFGGVTTEEFQRSGTNCLWIHHTSMTAGWRTLSHGLNNVMAGTTVTLTTLQRGHLSFLYLLAWPEWEHLRSHSLAMSLTAPLIRRILNVNVEPMVLVNHDQQVFPALLAVFRFRLDLWGKESILRLGMASSLLHEEDRRMTPVFESLSWGFLKRYSLYEGHLGMIRFHWPVTRQVQPFVHYHLATSDFTGSGTTDELDAGVEVHVGDWLRMVCSYAGLHLAGRDQASHGLYFEARIVAGQ